MLNEFVEKIVVHEPEQRRTRRVDKSKQFWRNSHG
ncbi:DUF4368 domain-containing protein [Desulforamulus ruminis]|nr:DUF4368 domain-containing protein [Desulforamulus ruminis]